MSDGSSGSYSSSGETSSTNACSGDGKTSSCCRLPPYDECNESIESNQDDETLFQHVCTISLNNSMVDCWEDLDKLRHWPSLVELRLQSCPLFRVCLFLKFRQWVKVLGLRDFCDCRN